MPVLDAVRLRKQKAMARKQTMEGVVNRTTLRPSERAHLDLADEKVSALMRPMIAAESPSLYRVFNQSVQRVALHYSSLCSWAAFILVVDTDREVVGWFGEECKLADRKMASELGLQVLNLDLRKQTATFFPFTSENVENLRILRYILPKLWCDEALYKSKKSTEDRRKMCINSPVSVGILDKFIDGSYALRETALAAVDQATGSVPRLRFVDIEKNTIAVVTHGDQWDIWVARGCSVAEEELATSYVNRLAATRRGAGPAAASALNALKKGNPNIRVVKQGCERVLFRCLLKALTDFEPPGKCVPWQPPGPNSTLLDLVESDVAVGLERILVDPFGSTVQAVSGAARGVGNLGGAIADVFVSGGDKAAAGPLSGSGGVRQSSSRASGSSGGAAGGGGGGSGGGAGGGGVDATVEKERANLENSKAFGGGVSAAGDAASSGKKAFFGTPDLSIFKGEKWGSLQVPEGSQFMSAPPRKGHPYEGRDMLTHDMMDFNDDLSMGVTKSNQVIEAATYEPFILVGYQIEIDEGLFRGRHVVTATRKTPVFQKSQFRLSSLETEDVWLKLKRGHKVGVPFRVLRRVFDPI